MSHVSVIVPTYNRKVLVQEAIDSVLAQTYVDYEIIVVDDGSTDGTGEMLRARYGKRIQYEWQENQGESAARNRGIHLARGTLIAFLDSDDLWLPEKLERQTAHLNAAGDVGMSYAQAWLIDETGERYGQSPVGCNTSSTDYLAVSDLYLQNVISGPSTVLLKSEVLRTAGEFDPSIRYGEDWDLWLRVARVSAVQCMREPLTCIRRHRSTQCYYPDSPTKIARVLEDHLRVLSKAFESCPSAVDEQIRRRSMANQYLEAFAAEASVGNEDRAQLYLAAAQAQNAQMLTDMQALGKLVMNQLIIVAEAEPDRHLDEGVQYINRVLENLRRVGASRGSFERKLKAEANATLGFWAHQKLGRRAARPFLVRAVQYDPRWLKNLGLVSLVVKSTLLDH